MHYCVFCLLLFPLVLKEQLREKDQRILELERKMDEKERELHAIRLDNEAVRFGFFILGKQIPCLGFGLGLLVLLLNY